VRLLGAAPSPGLFTMTTREYERLPGIFSPGQRVVEAAGTRFEHETRIDSLGYRGSDFPRAKPAGERRVLYAGDSFTYGHNVGDAETLPAQLERMLSEACGPARVINAGVSGTAIAGQDEMIRRGLPLDPDLVVLMYHENDIDELAFSRIWDQLAENRRIKSRFPVSVVYHLLRNSALWNLAQDVRRRLRDHPPQSAEWRADEGREEGPAVADADAPAIVAARAEYAERLRALRDTLGARGIPFVFVLYPHPGSVRDGHGARDYDWIRATAEGLGVPVVDLLPPLRGSGVALETLYLLPDDYHPAPAGFAVAARTVLDSIRVRVPTIACGP
jgi:lysophospholipase L1-like esterase